MGNSQFITTYQIDLADYTPEYGEILMAGCREMYPTKTIMCSIERTDNQVLLSVYATDQDN